MKKFNLNKLPNLVFKIFLICITLSEKINSQSDCDNIPYNPIALQYIEGDGGDRNNKLVKIYFHVYRKDDNSGGVPLSRLEDMMSNLSDYFSDTNISFYYNSCETEIIKSDFLYGILTPCNFFNLPSNKSDGINIHVRGDDSPAMARAEEVVSKVLILSGMATVSNIPQSLSTNLGHEIGHCFGLFHTHRGTCPELSIPCVGPQTVNSDAANNDFCADTPPDPSLRDNVNSSCEWNGESNCIDIGSNSFNPSTINFMSYSRLSCLSEFTEDQIDRMHELMPQEVIHENIEGCCIESQPM